MTSIHTCLWNEVREFHFDDKDLTVLSALPGISVTRHQTSQSFLDRAQEAEILLTWDFPADWYPRCPKLSLVMTPAAGTDWVEPDPTGRVTVHHGTFHGDLLAESLLEAMLFMNRDMKSMIRNYQDKSWDRNLQTGTLPLSEQHVLIIGYGNIGKACGKMLRCAFDCQVTGVRRQPAGIDDNGIQVAGIEDLDQLLPQADHVVLLLPGTSGTDRLMSLDRLFRCKPGAYLYNFGRGNALASEDVIAAADHLGGAYLDVTDEEPLPKDSLLWTLPNMMVTPHSSCVYAGYKRRFLQEVQQRLLV